MMGRPKLTAEERERNSKRDFQPTKSSERIRNKRLLSGPQKWTSYIAALKTGRESSDYESLSITTSSVPSSINEDTLADEPNDSDPEDAESNPLWQLYDAVRSCTNSSGIQLSDPFMRLPNRRFYPDYYQEIEHPMSLSKIKAKIKTGYYRDTNELMSDMNTMFENAKRYNRPDSKIFKDACKLQKIMQSRAKDLVDSNDRASNSDDSDDNEESCSGMSMKRSAGMKKRALANELKRARRSSMDLEPQLKKRMHILYKTLIDFVDDDDRSPISLFMEKPSRVDYPDYYEYIDNPIDMKTIESNIKNDHYQTEESLLSDFQLMFDNCKHYNEEGSQIYRDAELLEQVISDKLNELGSYIPGKRRYRTKANNIAYQKLKVLYDSVINYADPKTSRVLSKIFMKLPSKLEYPEYYEVIKRPIDLEKIGTKLKNNNYESLEDLLSEIILVFDNACKFNEPDSQLYKDALALQKVALQAKLELSESENSGVPDMKNIIQDLLTNLFISVYNHQDEEGRCYSDSVIEFCEHENKNSGTTGEKNLSLDQIKRNLNKKKYRRMDRFQQDMFKVFERVRANSRTDAQAFEDSVELQLYFIRQRNDACKNGELLLTNALSFTENDLNTQIEALKAEKLPFEQQEIDLDSKSEDKDPDATIGSTVESLEEVILNDQPYRPGDFVYIEPREKSMEPHIINISKLWQDSSSQVWITGCWFYRPHETYHLASKKFLEKEVFKSDNFNNASLSQVVGKCFIMFVKDYFKYKIEGFEDKDLYVCESRYSTKTKTFKKIKVWPYSSNLPLIPRDMALPMIRIPSIFKDQQEKTKDEPMEEDDDDDENEILDIDRPNVIFEPPENFAEEGNTYYAQFSIPCGSFKVGDCCYVRTDSGKNLICRIDKMWVDKDKNAFFHGTWFVQQRELPPGTSRMFYPQEVFLSSLEDTNPLLSICGKCAVLDGKDYITKRPTEIPEQDVYICEMKYAEQEKKFSRLSNSSLKKFLPQISGVVNDELFIFRKPLVISRTEYGNEPVVASRKSQGDVPSPLNPFRPSFDTENEESNSSFIPSDTPVSNLPSSVKKKGSKRLVTGYILFASEVRKSVIAANPECSFGEISRIIGNEWKNLSAENKQDYEKRATKQNEESAKEAAREAERLESFPQSPSTFDNGILECHWEGKCDFQCEDSQDLYDHLNIEPNGHVWKSYGDLKESDEPIFQCLFAGCSRVKKGAAPFPTLSRLIRHCKEIHVNKQQRRSIHPENRSRNFTPSKKSLGSGVRSSPSVQTITKVPSSRSSPPPVLSFFENSNSSTAIFNGLSNSSQDSSGPFWNQNSNEVQSSPGNPLFVASSIRPNRLLHTTTFIKYIERLRPETKHVSNWEHQLAATPENTYSIDKERLPKQWLANGEGNHGSIVNALWALRNYMLQDALNISRV